MQLPNFYSMTPAFGILSMFETWEVCWIPLNELDIDAIAKVPECLPRKCMQFTTPMKPVSAKNTLPQGFTPSKMNPVVHEIKDEVIKDGNSGEEQGEDNMSRVLHASKIYSRMDDEHLAMHAIVAAVCKMLKAEQSSFDDPFDKLKGCMLLQFIKGENWSLYWCHMGHLDGKGKWNKYANPRKYLYAIKDLGRGFDGRVWLMCTSSGAVCVLKFLNIDGKISMCLKKEVENWQTVYPKFKVFLEKWCGRESLQMPHFASVKRDDRMDVLDSVKVTLETSLDAKGLVHDDVAWHNVGLYKKEGTESKAIVFDLAHVHQQTLADANWVNAAIKKLKEGD